MSEASTMSLAIVWQAYEQDDRDQDQFCDRACQCGCRCMRRALLSSSTPTWSPSGKRTFQPFVTGTREASSSEHGTFLPRCDE